MFILLTWSSDLIFCMKLMFCGDSKMTCKLNYNTKLNTFPSIFISFIVYTQIIIEVSKLNKSIITSWFNNFSFLLLQSKFSNFCHVIGHLFGKILQMHVLTNCAWILL